MEEFDTINKMLVDNKYQEILLSLARLHGHLRNMNDIWSKILSDLLHKYDLLYLTDELQISARTIRRIVSKQTKRPSIEISFRILTFYLRQACASYKLSGFIVSEVYSK